MALIVFDGFDHYKTEVDLQSRQGALQWSDMENASGVTFGVGRGGYGQCATTGSGFENLTVFGGSFHANYSTAFMGIALLISEIPTGSYFDIRVMDYVAQVAQMTFRCFPDGGVIFAYAGDPDTTYNSLVATSPPNAFSPYIWNYIEIACSPSSSGSFDIHFNGNSVLSGSSVATKNPNNSDNFLNGLRFSSTAELATFSFDDFYLCDNTPGPGTYPCNTFLGDSAARTEFTTANSSVQWTPLTGANWQEVGETQFDGDTSYNYAVVVGDVDTFTFGSLPTTISAVYGVQVTGGYRKLDAGAQTIKQKLVSSGSTSTGATLSLSLSYTYNTDLFVVDPHTGTTWTPTAVNAIVAGYTLNS